MQVFASCVHCVWTIGRRDNKSTYIYSPTCIFVFALLVKNRQRTKGVGSIKRMHKSFICSSAGSCSFLQPDVMVFVLHADDDDHQHYEAPAFGLRMIATQTPEEGRGRPHTQEGKPLKVLKLYVEFRVKIGIRTNLIGPVKNEITDVDIYRMEITGRIENHREIPNYVMACSICSCRLP